MAARTGTKKTTPDLKELADDNTFAVDFVVNLADSSKVPQEVHDNNKLSVVASALQRGLRATAEPKVSSEDVVDEHNVKIVYTVAVEPNVAE